MDGRPATYLHHAALRIGEEAVALIVVKPEPTFAELLAQRPRRSVRNETDPVLAALSFAHCREPRPWSRITVNSSSSSFRSVRHPDSW